MCGTYFVGYIPQEKASAERARLASIFLPPLHTPNFHPAEDTTYQKVRKVEEPLDGFLDFQTALMASHILRL